MKKLLFIFTLLTFLPASISAMELTQAQQPTTTTEEDVPQETTTLIGNNKRFDWTCCTYCVIGFGGFLFLIGAGIVLPIELCQYVIDCSNITYVGP